ncbi:MAG: tRNA epoxyqueuosine(34) reductase QueG, partial [Ignavibacteria bacterium]
FIETITPLNSSIKGGTSEIKTRYYVDDGPVMDKAWAVKSGVGWMGKHTNVINPEYGSWLFLSEIITNLEFETYDEPIEDLCGSCRICIDACPTGAIIDEYKLDSNLCISYQTIENHGEIPENIELHGWVFGCDICQDVCPFNKNDRPVSDKDFYPKPEIYNKPLSELDNITEQQFKELFTDSPIRRTKYKGWKRNLQKNILN